MALNKKSPHSDAIANLYRAALYLGKGERAIGIKFLQKSPLSPLSPLPQNRKEELLLAERALDEFKRLSWPSLLPTITTKLSFDDVWYPFYVATVMREFNSAPLFETGQTMTPLSKPKFALIRQKINFISGVYPPYSPYFLRLQNRPIERFGDSWIDVVNPLFPAKPIYPQNRWIN